MQYLFKPKRDSLGNGVDTLIWTDSLSTPHDF